MESHPAYTYAPHAHAADEASEDDGPGARLVALAEAIITTDEAASAPGGLLGEVLTRDGLAAPGGLHGSASGAVPSPGVLFDALAPGGVPALQRHFAQFFEVVAAPGGMLSQPLQRGDLLLRRVLGEAHLGHASFVAGARRWSRDEVAAAGLTPEGERPGWYVQVVEGGAQPHRRADAFARQVLDADGRVPYDQMILRPRLDQPGEEAAIPSIPKLRAAITLAIKAWLTDVEDLTDLAFYLRHPAMMEKKIQAHQTTLATAWKTLRDHHVLPLVHNVTVARSEDDMRQALQGAIAAGWNQVVPLTNILFYAEHPYMIGTRIKTSQPALANAWLAIRDDTVVPALKPKPKPPKPKTEPLIVSVRTDFTVHQDDGTTVFHWDAGNDSVHWVAKAEVEIVGTGVSGVTKTRKITRKIGGKKKTARQSFVRLDTSSLADGDYTLKVTHSKPGRTALHHVGPMLATHMPSPPSKMYRPLFVHITLKDGLLTAASIPKTTEILSDSGTTLHQFPTTHGTIGNRFEHTWAPDHLPLDWKPIWKKSPMKVSEFVKPDRTISLVVVHHTGGPIIDKALKTFGNSRAIGNAHYLIDLNGHVIKLCRETRKANHTGSPSFWGGQKVVNNFSIGIEIVHRKGPYTEAQYKALLKLLSLIHDVYEDTWPKHRIIGHLEAATRASGVINTSLRPGDPGQSFDWERLEKAGWGMIPRHAGIDPGVIYDGYFSATDNTLLLGDRDSKQKYGGKVKKGFAGLIGELQADLAEIGYSIKLNAEYDEATKAAVFTFQKHFFSAKRKKRLTVDLGVVDRETAAFIKAVRAGIP